MSSSKSRPAEHHDGPRGEIMRMGYLKKLKTMKKKFFILRGESSEASARLEYYDSEKKWRNAQPPKRTISLKTCFNINRRRDTKQKYVIALYTKDDCFCIVLESEEDLQEWLKVLLKLQTGEDCVDGEPPKPTFEHVWKVNLQEKGLGDSKNLVGPYHVCLTDQTLSLVKITDDDSKPETLEFPLIHIRSCGVTGSFFYIEVGRQTVTGAGALWMLTEDANIAKNMNAVIFSAFSLRQKDQKDGAAHRKRSSSATESSKPTTFLQRRQTHGGAKPFVAPGYSAVPVASSLAVPGHPAVHCVPRPPSQRRHSVSAMSSGSMAQHQHGGGGGGGGGAPAFEPPDPRTGGAPPLPVVHQRTKSCPISESCEASPPPAPRRNSNPPCPVHRAASSAELPPHCGDAPGEQRRPGRRLPVPLAASLKSMTGTRERSDSMPSRNRTSSECGHHVMQHAAGRIPHYGSRPHSMHSRGLSYSPPVASGPCSTDSAGSSVSIDDGDVDAALSPRYGHSSTPDEPAIIEENCDDYSPWTREEELEKANAYVPMDRPAPSLSLPIHPSGLQRKVSAPASLKSSSPHHSYLEMCSPYGSSPLETGNYLPMSPGEAVRRGPGSGSFYSTNHSRGSSFAEETVDDYVPMAPNPTDDGYVDMEPLPGHRLHGDGDHHSDMSPGSSCSFTSGTPSADMRFPEYHLDKVSSYFTPSEEDELSSNDRPSRTYSFGSQSETKKTKGKMEVVNSSEDFRVRAFSVGSKRGTPRTLTKDAHRLQSRAHVLPHGSKSSSAPLLSSSWSGTTRQPQAVNDPMADLMEIDFRENKKKKRSGSRFRVTPVKDAASQLNLDLKGGPHGPLANADSGYVDMSLKSPSGASFAPARTSGHDAFSASPPSSAASPRPAFGKSPPKAFAFGRSPPKSPLAADKPASAAGGVSSLPDVASRFEPKNPRLAKSAVVATTPTLKTIGEKPDAKPQKFPATSSANLSLFALPNKMQPPGWRPGDAYVCMRAGEPPQPREEQNYVEMSGRGNRKFARANSEKEFHVRKTSLEAARTGNEDYLLMTGGSQPIAIRTATAIAAGASTGAQAQGFLRAGASSPGNSLRRNGRRKNRRRRGSREGAVSPAGETAEGATPTNSPRGSVGASPTEEGNYIEMNFHEDEDYAEMAPGGEIDDRRYAVVAAGSCLQDLGRTQAAVPDSDYAPMGPTSPIRGPGGRRKAPATRNGVPFSATASEAESDANAAGVEERAASSLSRLSLDRGLVCRQVSTSSSSSTEATSVKEGSGSRPPSGTGEGDITYASLDLAPQPQPPPPSSHAPANPSADEAAVTDGEKQEETVAEVSSPNGVLPPEAFAYVEIDFEKSTSLCNPFAKKVHN